MAVPEYNFEINRGTVFEQYFRLLDSDGDPVDLTGWGVRWFYSAYPGGPVLGDLGAAVLDGPAARFGAVIDGDTTRALVPGTYSQDLVLTPPPNTSPFRGGPYLRGYLSISWVISADG